MNEICSYTYLSEGKLLFLAKISLISVETYFVQFVTLSQITFSLSSEIIFAALYLIPHQVERGRQFLLFFFFSTDS